MASADLQFMATIRDAYVSNQSNQFLLTGNVDDLCRRVHDDAEDGVDRYVRLTEYLTERLNRNGRIVIAYNLARGIQFASDADRQAALACYLRLFKDDERTVGASSFHDAVSRSSSYVIPALMLLRKLCRASQQGDGGGPEIALILEYADSILPDNPINAMNDADRQRLIIFKEWLTDPAFVNSPHLLVLIAETASSVNSAIRAMPHMIHVHVPLPDLEERRRFIRWRVNAEPPITLKGSQKSFSELSAGMTLLGIEQTMRLAQYKKGRVEGDDFLYYLNRLLQSSIGDHIEIVQPRHRMTDVIGNSALKAQLKRLTTAMSARDASICPVGMLVTGPNGVGKTWTFMAWATECKRIVIILKNLRSSFFGETDQIFEKIRNVLEVLGNVMIIVDEADTVFGRPDGQTHETEARLFGNVIKMMGDTANRGRIVWVLMTARPDRLAPDLKRAGRCGLHLPIFDPEGDDRDAFLDFVLGKTDVRLKAFSDTERAQFLQRTAHLSAADFRELVGEFKLESRLQKRPLDPAMVLTVLADFQASDIRLERRLQTLHALRHCSRRSLIPPSLAELDPGAVQHEIQTLEQRLHG